MRIIINRIIINFKYLILSEFFKRNNTSFLDGIKRISLVLEDIVFEHMYGYDFSNFNYVEDQNQIL
jgi:hypothetical protein